MNESMLRLNNIIKFLFPWLDSNQKRLLRLEFLSSISEYKIETSLEFEDWNKIDQMKDSEISNLLDKVYAKNDR